MAALEKKRRGKMRASSLIEVVVALVIIMIVIGIATTTYVRVIGSSRSEAIRIEQQLDLQASSFRVPEVLPQDEEYPLDERLTIRQHAAYYEGKENLVMLELEALDQRGKRLGIYRSIIFKTDEETH